MGKVAEELAGALAFVEAVEAAYRQGLALAPPVVEPAQAVEVPPSGGVLVCAPHPDDESLTGALALRLAAEGGCAVTTLAITLGSDPARKAERHVELARASALLGWNHRLVAEPLAFDRITPAERDRDPEGWRQRVAILTECFDSTRPELVLLPHSDDAHPTHLGVHGLVMEALTLHTARLQRQVLVVESEFWRPLADPNLLVGLGPKEVARLVAAVACHKGEVARHPYQAQLPFRLVDNVRRGGELLAGYGGAGADFRFGELYRVGLLAEGVLLRRSGAALIVPPGRPLTLAALRELCR